MSRLAKRLAPLRAGMPAVSLRPLTTLSQALALALCVGGTALAQTAPAASTALHAHALPAGELGSLLSRYAAAAGVLLSFDPALTGGLQSPGLRGSFSVEQGFARLLAGSGLRAVLQADGGYAIQLTGDVRQAEPMSRGALPVVRVSEVTVAESAGATVLERRRLEGAAVGNGSITDALRTLAGVQFSRDYLSGKTGGELAAPEISINGAKHYDNLFLMDGASINNDINPGGAGAAINSPASAAQGYRLDLSQICRLTLRDANVGAEYGGFGGGVIDAQSCAPKRALAGELSLEHTSSSWTRDKIDPLERDAFAQSATAETQPAFDKWIYRATVEGRPTEKLGLRANLVSARAEIPLRGYTAGLQSGSDENRKLQTRRDDSFYLRGFWSLGHGHQLDFALDHAPGRDRHFIENGLASYYLAKRDSSGLNIGLHQELGELRLSHRLSGGVQSSARESDAEVWKLWRYSSDKDWGNPKGNSGEGGWGDVEETAHNAQYKLKAEWTPRRWLGLEHGLSAGLELQRQDFDYERRTGYAQYTASINTATCDLAASGVDTELCSLARPHNAGSGGQYLASRIVHKPGSFAVRSDSHALFVQDEMRLDRVRLRLGLRYDRHSLAPKAVLAPRLALFWDLFGDASSGLELGANRYYGRNFAIYRSYAERLSLQSSAQTRRLVGGRLGAWPEPVFGSAAAMYHAAELELPRADEFVLALSRVAADARWTAKYVDRKSRREVVMHLRSASNYWWDNVGHSDARTVSLRGESLTPLKLAGTATHFSVQASHSDVKSSHLDYADTLSSHADDLSRVISYNGRFIRYIDRPAENYNRPWALSLSTDTQIPAWGLRMSNVLNIRDSYVKTAGTGGWADYQGQQVAVYEKQKFGSAITWDLVLDWQYGLGGEQAVFARLTLENLLNRSNLIEIGTSGVTDYEKGRQVWLQLGYRF